MGPLSQPMPIPGHRHGLLNYAGRSLLLLMFISVVLPSGHIGPVNVKVLMFLIVLLLFVAANPRSSRRVLLIVLALFIWVFLWAGIGIVNLGSPYLPFMQAKDLLVTITISYLTYLAINNSAISPDAISKTVVYSAVGLGCFKIVLLCVSEYSSVPLYVLIGDLESFFRTQIMTMKIIGGLYRYQVVGDLISPIALYILISSNKERLLSGHKTIYIVSFSIIIFSVFISYSRYIWFMSVIAALLALLTRKGYALYFGGAIVVVGVGVIIGLDLSFIYKRIVSHAVEVSDNIRLTELHYLLSYFFKSPIIGHGLGAYVPHHIRDIHSKFSYELQWVAFAMQTGVIGVSFLLFIMAVIARTFLMAGITREKLSLLILFILWISSSLFNAYLASSSSAVIFAFFISEGFRIRIENQVLLSHSVRRP